MKTAKEARSESIKHKNEASKTAMSVIAHEIDKKILIGSFRYNIEWGYELMEAELEELRSNGYGVYKYSTNKDPYCYDITW